MRPRDFLIEVFKMFCRALDVSEIHAVSNLNHPQRQKVSDIKLSYDQVWRERGGVYDGNGFFILPVSRGADKDIPAKRRRTYRQRYAILKFVEAELNAVLK
jgi:uncharacterized protein VirK/YbjX